MSPQSQQLIAAIRDMSRIDFATLPGIQFMGQLRQALIAAGVAPAVAEALAARVEVELPLGQISAAEVTELAQLYACFLLKMREALGQVGIQDADRFLLTMAAPFTLKAS